MLLVPAHFLFRLTYPCIYQKHIPDESGDRLLDLPASCRIDSLPELIEGGPTAAKPFADVRLAWNETGLGFQVEVKGKEQEPQGDAGRPRSSDGAFLWIDTRDTRNIHRASRYCHQFYFLPTGGGEQHDEPAVGQLKINRATQDAPLCGPEQIVFQAERTKRGYILEAFLPATILTGFDPETNPRLGFFWWVRDNEKGEQTLGLGPEFPFWEDPSVWSTLELVRS
jgi:hypothetical protein